MNVRKEREMLSGRINRNDPCPCGSGKKYKKCCGSKDVIVISDRMEGEIIALQGEAIEFAKHVFGEQLQESFELEDLPHFDKEERDFYEFVHMFWFTAFGELDSGERIIDLFIEEMLPVLKNSYLKDILQKWDKPFAFAGIIKERNESKLLVEDAMSGQSFTVTILEPYKDIETARFAFGMLLPYLDHHVFFPAPFELGGENTDAYRDFLLKEYKATRMEDPQEFLQEFFLEMMEEVPGTAVSFEWPNEGAAEVADLFARDMEQEGEESWVIDMGVTLWMKYIEKTGKKPKKAGIYVAGLRYLVGTLANPSGPAYTQKQLGTLYGVSAASISNAYGEIYHAIEDVLEEIFQSELQEPASLMESERMMQDLMGLIGEKEFENEQDLDSFLQGLMNKPLPKKASATKKGKAQDIMYEAFEASGAKRYKLAEKALELNPLNSDAYNILAEKEDLPEAAKLFKKGMEAGQKDLGDGFFKENKGHFWGLIETRPFMRAKANYAQALHALGNLPEAIGHYEELLELNPNDNQGVRFVMFQAYCESRQYKKARKLLEAYPEEMAAGLFNQVLLELLEKGFTSKAAALLKKAKKHNPHASDYLSGKKKMPRTIPDYYSWGDKNEAITYADGHLHLWQGIPGIQTWLQNN
ncbi:tetratricopeptide repeat protein [Bacillus infantis]|nr:tetratricopeptide repeat protein [Bacillus infantis]